jgi:cytoskeletal protein RodZ
VLLWVFGIALLWCAGGGAVVWFTGDGAGAPPAVVAERPESSFGVRAAPPVSGQPVSSGPQPVSSGPQPVSSSAGVAAGDASPAMTGGLATTPVTIGGGTPTLPATPVVVPPPPTSAATPEPTSTPTTEQPGPELTATTQPTAELGVHAGAACSPVGATGYTSKGKEMRCKRKAGEDGPRWRAA